MPGDDRILRDQLLEFLRGGSAHIDFKSAVEDFPPALYGKVPDGVPYSAWQLYEHLRIALHDILDFCVNPKYTALDWPEDYWPKGAPLHPRPRRGRFRSRAIQADVAEFERYGRSWFKSLCPDSLGGWARLCCGRFCWSVITIAITLGSW